MYANQISKIGLTSLFIMALYAFSASAQDSLNVTRISQIPSAGFANDVVLSGNFAYLANGLEGLWIVNIADPFAPATMGSCDITGEAWKLVVSGSYAYVACGPDGLWIINIASSRFPTIVGYFPGAIWDVAVFGSYVCLAAGDAGLRIVNISNPHAPVEVGYYDAPGFTCDVIVSGSLAYIAVAFDGIRVINISNPAAPFEVGYFSIPGFGYINDLVYYGNLICAASGFMGVWISGTVYDTPGYACGVNMEGAIVYVADSLAGLRVVDFSHQEEPVEIGYYDTPGAAHGLVKSGEYIFVADGQYFGIYQFLPSAVLPFPSNTTPESFSLAPSYPNPFNPTTMVSFTLPHPARVTLEVFDINGRNVRAKHSENASPLQVFWYEAGTHTIPFDGKDLPSGIYLARLTAGDFSAVQKLVLLK